VEAATRAAGCLVAPAPQAVAPAAAASVAVRVAASVAAMAAGSAAAVRAAVMEESTGVEAKVDSVAAAVVAPP